VIVSDGMSEMDLAILAKLVRGQPLTAVEMVHQEATQAAEEARRAALTDDQRAEQSRRDAEEERRETEFYAFCESEDARRAMLSPDELAAELERTRVWFEETQRLMAGPQIAKPQPKKRRRKLSPIARQLAPVARKLKKSKHGFQQIDGELINFLIDGQQPRDVVPDEVLVRVMGAIGFQLPAQEWAEVQNFAGIALESVFRDAARAERARAAFLDGQKRKSKWHGTKQAAVARSITRGSEILAEMRKVKP
jgi:hypothetical protein